MDSSCFLCSLHHLLESGNQCLQIQASGVDPFLASEFRGLSKRCRSCSDRSLFSLPSSHTLTLPPRKMIPCCCPLFGVIQVSNHSSHFRNRSLTSSLLQAVDVTLLLIVTISAGYVSLPAHPRIALELTQTFELSPSDSWFSLCLPRRPQSTSPN